MVKIVTLDIDFPDEIHHKLVRIAAENNWTFDETIQRGLKMFLADLANADLANSAKASSLS